MTGLRNRFLGLGCLLTLNPKLLKPNPLRFGFACFADWDSALGGRLLSKVIAIVLSPAGFQKFSDTGLLFMRY